MHLMVNEEGAVLTDDSGLTVPIQEGRLVIGRSTDCDVVLHDAPADVSRKHLMIEAGHQEVRLTDLSSHGTYVPKRALANTQTRH
jgi:predicted component of type VI protein secretion system